MGRSLELRLGNACAQSPGCLACELMGGGEEPAWAGTKAGSPAAAGGWSDPESWGELVLTDREPHSGFLEEVSTAMVGAGATPPVPTKLPASLPQPGTTSGLAGWALPRAPCTCSEVLCGSQLYSSLLPSRGPRVYTLPILF